MKKSYDKMFVEDNLISQLDMLEYADEVNENLDILDFIYSFVQSRVKYLMDEGFPLFQGLYGPELYEYVLSELKAVQTLTFPVDTDMKLEQAQKILVVASYMAWDTGVKTKDIFNRELIFKITSMPIKIDTENFELDKFERAYVMATT